MTEIYIALVAAFWKTEVHNMCENVFFTPYSEYQRVIEACEYPWRESFPNAYINNK